MLVEWMELAQQNGRETATIDIHIRGFLLRRHMKRYRILQHQGIQIHVRDWITNLRWKHTTTVRTRAAINCCNIGYERIVDCFGPVYNKN